MIIALLIKFKGVFVWSCVRAYIYGIINIVINKELRKWQIQLVQLGSEL